MSFFYGFYVAFVVIGADKFEDVVEYAVESVENVGEFFEFLLGDVFVFYFDDDLGHV